MRWVEKCVDLMLKLGHSSDKLKHIYRYQEQDKDESAPIGGATMLINLDNIRFALDESSCKDVYTGVVDLMVILPHVRFDNSRFDTMQYPQVVEDIVTFIRDFQFSIVRDGYVFAFDFLRRQNDEYGYTLRSKGYKPKLRGVDIYHIYCKILWLEEPILPPKITDGIGAMMVAPNLPEGINYRPLNAFVVGGSASDAKVDDFADFKNYWDAIDTRLDR